MRSIDIVYAVAKKSHMNSSEIGPALGKNKAYVSTIKNKCTEPSAANLAAMLGVCGYTLCAIPNSEVPPNALVIDAPQPDNTAQLLAARKQAESAARAAERAQARYNALMASAGEVLPDGACERNNDEHIEELIG